MVLVVAFGTEARMTGIEEILEILHMEEQRGKVVQCGEMESSRWGELYLRVRTSSEIESSDQRHSMSSLPPYTLAPV